VKAMNVTDKTGGLVAIKAVVDSDDLMIINKSGLTLRTPVSGLRVMGRATQGVRLIKLGENDEIPSVEKLVHIDEEIDDELPNGEDSGQNPNEDNQTHEPNNLD